MLANHKLSMKTDRFTKAEATALLGTRIEAAYGFPSVPAGTSGTVKRIKSGDDGYAVTVEWDSPIRRKQYYASVLDFSFNVSLLRPEPHVTDDFTKDEFARLTKPASLPAARPEMLAK